jgi:membrane-associated phospholipid phosphatase
MTRGGNGFARRNVNFSVVDVHEVRAREDVRPSLRIALVVTAAAVVFVALAVVVWHGRRPIGIDDFLGGSVGRRSQASTLRDLAWLGSVQFVFSALAVVAVVAAVSRDAVAVALCAVGPALAGLIELVAKPTVDRLRATAQSYPSGHVTLAAALATVVVVVAYRLGGVRSAVAAAVPATLMTAAVAVAVVRLGWH